jgi:cellulose synthase/poly-beta-1,6-N-acetylglucosamine synthase-like glycosyltransferase
MSSADAFDLAERQRQRGQLLRRWAIIAVALAAFFALSEADRVYFEEGNIWTSWGTVPIGFLFLIFPVEYAVSTVWTLLTCHRLLRGEKRQRTPRYTNLPLERASITAWPTVTVQVPIYTEPFTEVIKPALDSALVAIRRFREVTGQRANLVVCDDGLLHFTNNDLAGFCAHAKSKAASRRTEDEREVLARMEYYRRHEVVWVARAKHVPGVPETERRGRFKKASNLNHSFLLEAALAKLSPVEVAGIPEAPRPEGAALPTELSPFRFAQWSGNVELGEIILQLDKDSICHPEIILATVPEFVEDHELAYTQHASYPTNETDNYFAMIIGAFTRGLYDIAIPSRCQFDGNQVPVMGHNLFFRKSVLLGIGLWGEMTCEDLDFMMRVHVTGQHGRYVAFPGLEFGEAVTRTYTEEVEKYRRYAFGAAEAILNPIRDWERLGVIKKSFRRFAASPHVGWYHIVDLVGFFLSMLNIASIIPAALAVGLGFIPFQRAFARFLLSSLIFQILGTLVFWQVRKKGNLGRMTEGSAWRGVLGGLRAFAAVLVSGTCFAGFGLAIIRGALAYLFQRKLSFAATATDDLERVSLGGLLQRMKSSHVEAAALSLVSACVVSYQIEMTGGTTPIAEFWLIPLAAHITLPYLMNPYLVRKLIRGPLELLGMTRASLPQPGAMALPMASGSLAKDA